MKEREEREVLVGRETQKEIERERERFDYLTSWSIPEMLILSPVSLIRMSDDSTLLSNVVKLDRSIDSNTKEDWIKETRDKHI